jgi:hypothetical protein
MKTLKLKEVYECTIGSQMMEEEIENLLAQNEKHMEWESDSDYTHE